MRLIVKARGAATDEFRRATGFAGTLLARARGLAPTLQFWPPLGQSAEFRTPAQEHVDLFFESVGVVSRRAYVLHMLPQAFENLSAVVEDDHAVPGVATRAPEEPGLVTAEGRWEAVAATEEIDGPSLAIVLGEDAAVVALLGWDAIPSDRSFVGDFFPAELVGVPLRQCGPCVGVFHDGELEGEILCVCEKTVRRRIGTTTGARYAPLASRKKAMTGFNQWRRVRAFSRRCIADSTATAPAASSMG